jgi:hypothetical protein
MQKGGAMETVFSKEIRADLDRARVLAAKRTSRLRAKADGAVYPVLRMWKGGFAMADDAPALRGLIDLFDGEKHLFQCLIVASADEAGERQYEFKRATIVADRAALDFELPENAPVALIGPARL